MSKEVRAPNRPSVKERLLVNWDVSAPWLVLFTALGFAAAGWAGGLAMLLFFGGCAIAGRLWL